MTSLRFASFFSGIGGFELGLEAAGHRCVFACEVDPFARAVYEHRFGREPAGDINLVRSDEIPDAELWCGGFPCQDLSVAGRREGIDGERSGLVWRLLDLAAAVRPKWILLENVPGLLSVDGGSGFGRLLAKLDDLGYVGAWRVLDAKFYGVPQRRRRVFILAGRAGEGLDPAAILLESESVRRSPQASGSMRPGAATGSQDGAGGGLAPTLSASFGHHGRSSSRRGDDEFVSPPVTSKWAKGTGGPAGDEVTDLVAQTVQSHHARNAPDDQLVVVAATGESGGYPNSNEPGRRREDDLNLVAYQCHGSNVGPFGTVRSGNGNETGGVPFIVNAAESGAKKSHARESETSRCLDGTGGFAANQGGTVIAFDPTQITSKENRSRCEPGEPSPPGSAKARTPHVAFGFNSRAESGSGGNGFTVDGSPPVRGTNPPATQAGSFIRRLTPRECERLQGLPDDWTAIPGASDSRRYKAIGNSVAVPVLKWIGERLARFS